MADNPANYEWIKARIERMWPKWLDAYQTLKDRHNENKRVVEERTERKVTKPSKISHFSFQILVHMGFLTKETNLKMSEKAGRGGPLGELVQWSDTIAALYLLGHKLHISSEQSNMLR